MPEAHEEGAATVPHSGLGGWPGGERPTSDSQKGRSPTRGAEATGLFEGVVNSLHYRNDLRPFDNTLPCGSSPGKTAEHRLL